MSKKGFTLAEVLITIGIIGVIAGMTLPALINNYQKHVLVVQVKDFYAIFNNALMQYMNDSGYDTLKDSPIGDLSLSQKAKEEYLTENFLKTYIKGQKTNVTLKYDLLSGKNGGYITYHYITNTGVLIKFSKEAWDSLQTVYFDINGTKKPNRFGLDAFRFYIYEKPISLSAYKRLMDWDCSNCGDSCRPDINPNATGYGCWIRILQENGINYD